MVVATPKQPKPKPILARSTAHLPDGIHPGKVYWVDPTPPYIQECIRAGLLVPVQETPPEPDEIPGLERE